MKMNLKLSMVILIVWTVGAMGCTFLKRDAEPECRPEFTYLPPVPGVDYLEFTAVGDTGSGNEGQRIVAESMKEYALQNPVQFVLYLGDNFYPKGVSSVDDPLFQTSFEDIYDKTVLNIPFYIVAGNHDYIGNVDAQLAYSARSERWNFPALYYSFTVEYGVGESVQFFALDTNPIANGEDVTEQLTWLEDELSRSEAGWRIVFGHHFIYSNGEYGNSPEMIERVLPLLMNYGVKLYISGHEHDMQLLRVENGLIQVISGAGSRARDTFCRENSLYAASLLGFSAFRVSHDEIVISAILDKGKRDYAFVISR